MSKACAAAALGAAAAAGLKLALGRQGLEVASSSSTGAPADGTIDAVWLTAALREGGLLGLNQHVAHVEIASLGAGGESGCQLQRVYLEYAGSGDLAVLPRTLILKRYEAAWDFGPPRQFPQRLGTWVGMAAGMSAVQKSRMEHAQYAYLASGAVQEQPWAWPAPAIYFNYLEAPVETPSEVAVLLGGAWTGASFPRVRSLLLMEDLVRQGYDHFDQLDASCYVGEGRFTQEMALATLRLVARWHGAHWGIAAVPGVPSVAPPLYESIYARNLTLLGIDVGSFARRPLTKKANGGHGGAPCCPLTDAALALHRRGRLTRRLGKVLADESKREYIERLVGAPFESKEVVEALRGLELAYGPVLAPRIRERLRTGQAARRNRTLLHGDVGVGNVLCRKDGEHEAQPASSFGVRVLDFQMAGLGPAAYELLYFLQWHGAGSLVAGAPEEALRAYHSELHAASGAPTAAAAAYTLEELQDDFALAVAEWAAVELVDAGQGKLLEGAKLVLLGKDEDHGLKALEVRARHVCHLLLILGAVFQGTTAVGASLRNAAMAASASLDRGLEKDVLRSRL